MLDLRPELTMISPLGVEHIDSLDIQILINGQPMRIYQDLTYYEFFVVNYSREYGGLTIWAGNDCFSCR